MDILIKLKNQASTNKGEEPITLNELAAQLFIFFVGGFETSSGTMAFCLYELASNPEVQTKARQAINQAFEKYNGEFTYEMMMDMPYIEQVIQGIVWGNCKKQKSIDVRNDLPMSNKKKIQNYYRNITKISNTCSFNTHCSAKLSHPRNGSCH